MMHASINMESIEKALSKLADDIKGIDIDAAAIEALNEIGDTLLEDMQEGVGRHYKKGRAFRALKRRPVISAGNVHSVEVGAMDIRSSDRDGFHIIYQEYGSPTMAADPWLRPANERLKQYKNQIIKSAIKRRAGYAKAG